MILELGKTASFVLCVLSLYSVLLNAFFEPGTTWQHRLLLGLSRLAIAACVSIASGLLFSFPARTNPDSGTPLIETIPVRLFMWTAILIVLLFPVAWYVRCGGLNSFTVQCDCF